ncbi:hypothetical protein [Mesorhizobium sp.]|uniref:hypothetical protein n=1 Tax=Mesorhizobium sp. TaxID=1871066 RepID=UPI0025F174A3|nr:hypothetical protein [Mesorhizobium sp.]
MDMIKKCAAPSFANDNWYQVVDGISSGRTAMTIDSNYVRLLERCCGEAGIRQDRLRSAAARTERHELGF